MTLERFRPLTAALLLSLLAPPAFSFGPGGEEAPPVEQILSRMKEAYRRVPAYVTETEVLEYREGNLQEEKRFRYSFQKPRRFRIDMRSPRRGTVLTYSELDGKIAVRPGGVGRFVQMRLDPDNRLLSSPSGQRLDQTDLGFLIEHIDRATGAGRCGEVRSFLLEGRVALEVLARDNFLPKVLTAYRFEIDSNRWLPVGVTERTPEGVLKRKVIFRDMRVVNDYPAGFMDGKGEVEDE